MAGCLYYNVIVVSGAIQNTTTEPNTNWEFGGYLDLAHPPQICTSTRAIQIEETSGARGNIDHRAYDGHTGALKLDQAIF